MKIILHICILHAPMCPLTAKTIIPNFIDLTEIYYVYYFTVKTNNFCYLEILFNITLYI